MFSRQRLPAPLALLATLLLSACAAVPPGERAQQVRATLYEQRFERLKEVEDWSLEGRLAISDSEDGGSGQLRWRQRDNGSRLDFHGALGRGAWRLEADRDGAELEFADGRQIRAPTIDALVRAEVGWQLPVESLAWWIRGLVAPGSFERRVLDEEGRLNELEQDGWRIEFGRYGAVGEVSMPMRMTAREGERTVKLAVRRWLLAAQDEPD